MKGSYATTPGVSAARLGVLGLLSGLMLGMDGCAGSPEASRDVNVVPLIFTEIAAHGWREPESGEYGGVAMAAVLVRGPAGRDVGQVGYLAMDTGSALTFLYLGRDGERYVERAGTVRIGCETIDLPGRNFEKDNDRGIGIIGVLGADFLLDAPSVFDPREGLITRYPGDIGVEPGSRAIDQLETVTEVPFENIEGHIIVTVRVEGRDLRLMWDTGCPHLLWLGEAGRAGDEEHTGQDVEGGQFPMYFGAATLELPGEAPASVPALRVPRFPYYEGTVESLGGNIQGLAGQSVFGRRVMVFDRERGVIRLGAPEGIRDESAE